MQDDLTGTLDEEMAIVCSAVGARPAATIDWVFSSTDEVTFEVEEETKLLVKLGIDFNINIFGFYFRRTTPLKQQAS